MMPSFIPSHAIQSLKSLGRKLCQSSMNIGLWPSASPARIRMALMYCRVQSTTGKNTVDPGTFEVWAFQPR
jgi:hypothetical protein